MNKIKPYILTWLNPLCEFGRRNIGNFHTYNALFQFVNIKWEKMSVIYSNTFKLISFTCVSSFIQLRHHLIFELNRPKFSGSCPLQATVEHVAANALLQNTSVLSVRGTSSASLGKKRTREWTVSSAPTATSSYEDRKQSKSKDLARSCFLVCTSCGVRARSKSVQYRNSPFLLVNKRQEVPFIPSSVQFNLLLRLLYIVVWLKRSGLTAVSRKSSSRLHDDKGGTSRDSVTDKASESV